MENNKGVGRFISLTLFRLDLSSILFFFLYRFTTRVIWCTVSRRGSNLADSDYSLGMIIHFVFEGAKYFSVFQ